MSVGGTREGELQLSCEGDEGGEALSCWERDQGEGKEGTMPIADRHRREQPISVEAPPSPEACPVLAVKRRPSSAGCRIRKWR